MRSRSTTARSIRRRRRVDDIRVIEVLTPERPLGVDFYRKGGRAPTCAGLKVFSQNRPISLSERVPVLENIGFRVVDERTYHIRPVDAADVWFHDMSWKVRRAEAVDLAALEAAPRSLFPRRDGRAGRERRLQRAGARGRARLARCRAHSHHLALSAPDPRALFARLHVGDAAQAFAPSPRRS